MKTLLRLFDSVELWFFRASPLSNFSAFVALCVFALTVQSFSSFQAAEWRLYDKGIQLLRKMDSPPAVNEVVLIGIDESTFERIPEPFALWHPHLGRLIDAMVLAQPSVVGFDVVLPAQSYESVVPGIDKTLMLPLLNSRGKVPLVFAQTVDENLQPRSIFPGFTALMQPWQLASALLCWDDDSVVRRHQSSQCTDAGKNDGLAVGMAEVLKAPERGFGLIDYRLGGQLKHVPMHEVLSLLERQDTQALKQLFEGKPVLVGLVLPLEDRLKVPAPLYALEPENQRVPGVMVHAQVLRSLLNQGLIKPVPRWLEWLLIIACCLCWFGHGFRKSIFYWALFVLIPAVSLYVLWLGYVLMPAALILAAKTAYLAKQGLHARRMAHQRKRLAQAFAGHVNPQVLTRILHSHSNTVADDLSPKKVHGAVLLAKIFPMCDIHLTGDRELAAMAVFYDEVTEAIEHSGGVVERFHGTEMTAWFGVPLGLERPEVAALEAALHLKRSYSTWSSRMQELGLVVNASVSISAGLLTAGQVALRGAYPFLVTGPPLAVVNSLAEQSPTSGSLVVWVDEAVALAVNHKGLKRRTVPSGVVYQMVLE